MSQYGVVVGSCEQYSVSLDVHAGCSFEEQENAVKFDGGLGNKTLRQRGTLTSCVSPGLQMLISVTSSAAFS